MQSILTMSIPTNKSNRIRLKGNMRLQHHVPEQQVDHRDRNAIREHARDDWPLPISLLVVIIHLLAASKLPLNPPPLAHNEVQQHPQQNQTQEHDPAVAHRSRHRRDIRSVEDSLALNSPIKTHLAHLVVDETLRHRHADGRPEVLSQSLLRRVVEEVVRLANGRHRQQAPDDQSNRHKRMLRDRTSSRLPTARSTACSSGRTRSTPRSRR